MSRTPKYIFAGDFRDLESYFAACPHKDVSFRKGDYLRRHDGRPDVRLDGRVCRRDRRQDQLA